VIKRQTVTLSEQSLSNLPLFDQDYIGAMSRFLDLEAWALMGFTRRQRHGCKQSRVSPSAIKEIKINQDPYSAEYQRLVAAVSR